LARVSGKNEVMFESVPVCSEDVARPTLRPTPNAGDASCVALPHAAKNAQATPFRTSIRAGRPLRMESRRWTALLALGLALGCGGQERSFSDQTDGADAGGGESSSSSRDGNGSAGSSDGGIDESSTTQGRTNDSETLDSSDESEPAPSTGDGVVSGNTGATSDGEPNSTTTDPSGTSDPTSSGVDFGVGEAPDYGDLGSGDGRMLAVNTLLAGERVDVWVAGSDEPLITALEPEAAARVTVPSGAHRVVFTRTGTRDVVGCSSWFPLRDDEQWAVVASAGEHTCFGDGDGVTLSFRQAQDLDGNSVRYVHATSPDTFSFARDEQAEAGTLEHGATLTGTGLPSCTSGCEVRYKISAAGIDAARFVTWEINTLEALPVAGEVMLVVLGNIRQDWPAEPDSLRLLRVDLDGTTYVLRRDPEVAFGRIGDGIATFSISTPPSVSEIATANSDCGEDTCPLETLTWRAGKRNFLVEAPEGSSELEVEFEAGQRYVLLSTNDPAHPLYWLDADFDRSQTTEAYTRAINLDTSGESLTLGYVFGDSAVAIEGMTEIPWGGLSPENGGLVPAEEGWDLVTALGASALGIGCFYSMDTLPGFRGYFVAAELMQPLDITTWPPTLSAAYMVCF
jgi:hypothetical protein